MLTSGMTFLKELSASNACIPQFIAILLEQSFSDDKEAIIKYIVINGELQNGWSMQKNGRIRKGQMAGTMDKIAWSGRIVSVQPRIRLTRSFDERYHGYH